MTPAEITTADLAAAMANGPVRLFDVREPDEFAAGRVPGAIPVPLQTVPDNIDKFRGDGPAYVICRSGGRSAAACEFLAANGVDVVNIAGGTAVWANEGRDLEIGDTSE
ncbi:MAG: rhodanese-like domain-containing protein [Ilumatobacteraceae bacterium]